jgi:hypothetical protein
MDERIETRRGTGRVDGRPVVPVPYAQPPDLAWLDWADRLSGRHAARYVLAGGPDDPDRLTGWITMVRIR